MRTTTENIGWGSECGLWVIESRHNRSVRVLVLGTSTAMIAVLLDDWGARPAFSLLDPFDDTPADWIGWVLLSTETPVPTDAEVGSISVRDNDVYLKCINWRGDIAEIKLPSDDWDIDEDDDIDGNFGFGWSVSLHYCLSHMALVLPAGSQRSNLNCLLAHSQA